MRLSKIITMTSIAIFGIAGASLPAQAATHYHRTKTVKVSPKAYYSTSNKGRTYKFVGSTKKFTFKANHALKNYHQTTWTRTAKTTVTKAGKKVTYYYVKNAKKSVSGWVAASYLKAGKNYQTTKATKVKSAPYYRAKAVKYTKFSGKNSLVKLSNGAALKTNLTYYRTQQKSLYLKGKKTSYVYVTSADKKTKGWVKASALKAGKDYQMSDPAIITIKPLIMAKAGNVYALTGSNKLLKKSNAKALSDNTNYSADLTRNVYLKGKKHLYYHVVNLDGTVSGWVDSANVTSGRHTTLTSDTAFSGRSEDVLFIGANTPLYENAGLSDLSTISLKKETHVVAYPDGTKQLANGEYAVPLKVNDNYLYLKAEYEELPFDNLLPAGYYMSLSDTSFYGDILPTDPTVKNSAPFLAGTTWKYYYAGGDTLFKYDGTNWQIETTK